MFASMNSRLLYKVFSDVCESEKTGKPHLLTLVVTEPSSGTDIQEPLLIHHAKTQSSIKRVEGGWIANGTKIFITNGLVSYWHLCHFWEDKNNKAETWVQCLVSNDDKGFSFGSHEKKMGQDACSAAELVFEDCFIADDQITFRSQDPEFKNSKKGPKWVCHTVVDLVTQCTRTGTAAISTGMARNAFETALQYARQKKVDGELLINHQWAQIILTDMYSNVNMSRLAYMESANALAISGIFKLLFIKPVYHYLKIMPKWFFKIFVSPFLKIKIASDFLRLIYFHRFTNEARNATSGWASLCKCSCSDIGLMNANLALDLMGADGIRHDSGAEKCFRDVKLQQIYESTNQINRMNLFYCLVANTGKIPEVEYFK
jgi:alkylation response protein AidB-like acyl-CoA dehydrogenase